jgi:NAD(P)-dependent dehydrogenase (short-subunit alcohol dehydrogenase family)
MGAFEGRKLIAVGGSSGMGRQSAEDVVAAGGSVVIIGRDQARVEDTVNTLSQNGKAWGITADLANRDDVKRVQDTLAADHVDATLLVNSAGFFIPKPYLDYEGADYDAYLELARSAFFITQTITRGMIAAGGGAIVNIGSMWAHQAIAVTPATGYSMGKAALHALTRNLAMELAEHKIRVNAVAPAVVATRCMRASCPRTSSRPRSQASTASTRWAG